MALTPTSRKLIQKVAAIHGVNGRWYKISLWKNAAGRTWKVGDGPRSLAGYELVFGTHNTKPWNPLENEKDAIDLAVAHDVFTKHLVVFQKHIDRESRVASISKQEALFRAIVKTVIDQHESAPPTKTTTIEIAT